MAINGCVQHNGGGGSGDGGGGGGGVHIQQLIQWKSKESVPYDERKQRGEWEFKERASQLMLAKNQKQNKEYFIYPEGKYVSNGAPRGGDGEHGEGEGRKS